MALFSGWQYNRVRRVPGMQSEWELIRALQRRARRGRGVRVGIGDDAAVLAGTARHDWVVTTDLLVENVHFLREAQPARALGYRALARSLSDIAAMAAVPRYALVALAVPPELATSWAREFFAGLLGLARRYRVALAGGDLSAAERIVADVQVLGIVEKGQAVARHGARPGEQVFVSGELGTSRLGLEVLRAGLKSVSPPLKRAVRAHLYPQPRLHLARALRRRFLLTAMIDVSDGLSTDLDHLCQASGVGAVLYAAQIPAVRLPRRRRGLPEPVARRLGVSELELALHGGEDYELLFTLPASAAAHVPVRLAGVRLHHIGRVVRGRKIMLVDAQGRAQRLFPGGWDHFARTKGATGRAR